MRNQKNRNREGITLLFVVSMIVLFLLMGTTFVVISNDYFRASRKRSKAKLYTVDRTALVHRAFYDIVRGPSLLDVNSPFRCNDLLSDQYAYGFKAFVNGFNDTRTDSRTTWNKEDPENVVDHFIRITLRSDTVSTTVPDNSWFRLHRPDVTTPTGIANVTGLYNGLVLTFTTGPAKGASTRIVDHTFVPGTATIPDYHYFTIYPTWLDGGAVPIASLANSEVVINSKEFSGTGAGDYVMNPTHNLTPEALNPNRIGDSLETLLADYLSAPMVADMPPLPTTFPNEAYDAADFQNMFLSGRDSAGNIIPSFHRKSLYDFQFAALTNPTPAELRKFSFRPIFLDEVNNSTGVAPGDGIPDDGSTANQNFAYNQHVLDSAMTAAADDLEVDADFDGLLDSVFIDPGYGILTDPSGKRFKPLVAYHIVDLDGRLNLNAHGNLTQIPAYGNYISTSITPLGGGGTATLPRGQGYGLAEVNLFGLLGNEYEQTLFSRYSGDMLPGNGAIRQSTKKLYGYPIDTVDWAGGNFGTVTRSSAATTVQGLRRGSLFASSGMNIHGRLAIATPDFAAIDTTTAFDNFRDPNFPTVFPNALPVIDMVASGSGSNEFDNNPYEMSFGRPPFGDAFDNPFTPAELERVLRQFDVDSKVLPDRLWNVANATWLFDDGNRSLVTTDSFEVPVIHENFRRTIDKRLIELFPALTRPQRITLSNSFYAGGFFAPELLAGLKMDVNRAFGNGYDDDDDGVVDEPDEADLEFNRDYDNLPFDLNHDFAAAAGEGNVRAQFAKHLYMLMLLLADPVNVDLDGDGNSDFERVVAQWAINVVDFRDPDSIMTQFNYDPNPWDGMWNPLTDGTNTVWGCERPEMLISESFAFHDRRNEDRTAPGGGTTSTGDDDYDSRLRPNAGAFVELYNPWTQNSLNQRLDESLYAYTTDTFNQGVDLARKSNGPSGTNSPVWRLSVERPDRSATPDPENTTPLRYVYFTDPLDGGNDTVGDDNGAGVEVFYSDFAATVIRPGEQAVIGSVGNDNGSGEYIVPMGRLATKTMANEVPDTLDLATTRSIILDPANDTIETFPADTAVASGERRARILPINLPRSFNVSDQFGGYNSAATMPETPIADGIAYTGGFDQPLDATTDVNRDDDDLMYIWLNGEIGESFRVVKLQRLANPLLPFAPTTDPNPNPYLTIDQLDMDLTGFNGATTSTASAPSAPDDQFGLTLSGTAPTKVENNVSHERGEEDGERLLFKSGRATQVAGTSGGTGDHYFDMPFTESLGKTNSAYINNATSFGYAWLNWNNRPYVSHLELTDVTFSSPNWLTRNFSDLRAGYDAYSGANDEMRGRFTHLLNFFANDNDGGGDRANLYRLMDYLEVPSRFRGTEKQLNPATFPAPYDNISRYRIPGKVNLNTIYCDPAPDPLTPIDPDDSTIWEAIQGVYATLGVDFVELRGSRENSGPPMPTDFGNPFRPADQGANVPMGVPSVTSVGSTIFRSDGAATPQPLFDFVNASPAIHSGRSAYFRHAQRQRLGNLVTTRSSVFAIWVTVAYFEVDDQGRVGAEVGVDTGDTYRNRGFFIYDRSIPVGFEPGKNHNVERGILVQSIIE